MGVLTMHQEQDGVLNAPALSVLQKLFTSALLVAGSEAGAERSILQAIYTMSSGEISSDALFTATLMAAVAPQAGIRGETSESRDLYTSSLPVELRQVLLLPDDLRRCFVLRRLLGLALGECSRLLSLRDFEIEQNTVCAALELAALDAQATVRWREDASIGARLHVVDDD